MTSWYRFVSTTIDKLCKAKTVEELEKAYNDAKDGWTTSKGEVRGGFDRLGLSATDIALINDVYNKLYTLLQNQRQEAVNNIKGGQKNA